MKQINVLIVDDDEHSLRLSLRAMEQLVEPTCIHCAQTAAETMRIPHPITASPTSRASVCAHNVSRHTPNASAAKGAARRAARPNVSRLTPQP